MNLNSEQQTAPLVSKLCQNTLKEKSINMNLYRNILYCSVSLFIPVLSSPAIANHDSGFIAYERSQAIRFTQCHPELYTHWFSVDKGGNLTEIIPNILATLGTVSTVSPEPTSTISTQESSSYSVYESEGSTAINQTFTSHSELAPSATEIASITATTNSSTTSFVFSTSSSTSVPIPLSTPTPTTSGHAPKSVSEHKVLIFLEGEVTQNYTLSGEIILNNRAIGFCTKPPASVPHEHSIPAEKQAVIEISEALFPNFYTPAITVNDGSELTLESVQIDAHAWRTNYPVLLLLGRAKGIINNSTLLRLRGNLQEYTHSYGFRSTVVLGPQNASSPTLDITNSRLYQGMLRGANIFAINGGNITITDTEQVIASGISLELHSTELDVFGGSIVGCNSPISAEGIANFDHLPRTISEFCPTFSNQSAGCAYYGSNNLLNFQSVILKGGWDVALTFDYDHLKVSGIQNTGNTVENFGGRLCAGHLQEGALGAVGFSGIPSCPSGSQFANSQTPAIQTDSPTLAADTQSASSQTPASQASSSNPVTPSPERSREEISSSSVLGGSLLTIVIGILINTVM